MLCSRECVTLFLLQVIYSSIQFFTNYSIIITMANVMIKLI